MRKARSCLDLRISATRSAYRIVCHFPALTRFHKKCAAFPQPDLRRNATRYKPHFSRRGRKFQIFFDPEWDWNGRTFRAPSVPPEIGAQRIKCHIDAAAMQEALSDIIGAYKHDFAKHPNCRRKNICQSKPYRRACIQFLLLFWISMPASASVQLTVLSGRFSVNGDRCVIKPNAGRIFCNFFIFLLDKWEIRCYNTYQSDRIYMIAK